MSCTRRAASSRDASHHRLEAQLASTRNCAGRGNFNGVEIGNCRCRSAANQIAPAAMSNHTATPKSPRGRTVQQEGYSAGQRGLTRKDNPYPVPRHDALVWERG